MARQGQDERRLGDERVLGSNSFVEEILKDQTEPQPRKGGNLDDVLTGVGEQLGIPPQQILSRTRGRKVSRARRMFFLRAHEEAGESMASLGRLCGLAHTSVREAIERARHERDSNE